jgi:hypothetical protein
MARISRSSEQPLSRLRSGGMIRDPTDDPGPGVATSGLPSRRLSVALVWGNWAATVRGGGEDLEEDDAEELTLARDGGTVGHGGAADEERLVPAPRRPRRSAEARPSGGAGWRVIRRRRGWTGSPEQKRFVAGGVSEGERGGAGSVLGKARGATAAQRG